MLTAAKRMRAALSTFCRELLLCPLKSMWPLPGVTKARLTLDQGGHLPFTRFMRGGRLASCPSEPRVLAGPLLRPTQESGAMPSTLVGT